MRQTTFFDRSGQYMPPHETGSRLPVRRNGPETSRIAAEKMAADGRLSKCRARAKDAVLASPWLTGTELDRKHNVHDRAISKRLAWLADSDPPHIRRGEKRICSVTGQLCFTWGPLGDASG